MNRTTSRAFRGLLSVVLVLTVLTFAYAGVSNLDSLDLKPTASDTNSLVIRNTSGTAQVTVAAAGGVTLANAVTMSGNVTLGDAGTDTVTINADTVTLTTAAQVIMPDTAYFTRVRAGTGSTPGDANAIAADGLYVEGAAEVDGAFRADGNVTLGDAASDILTINAKYAVTKHFWLAPSAFCLPSSDPAALGEEGSVPTLVFADASADDNAWISFLAPDDCDTTAVMSVYVYYILPSGTPSAGEWNFKASGFSDDDAISAAATDLTTITDTPIAGDLNITTATTIPAVIVAKGIINLHIYHDVDAPFGGTVELVGLRVAYTSNKP